MLSARSAVTQPFSQKPARVVTVPGQRKPRPAKLRDYTSISALTANVGLRNTGDFITWCESWSHLHDQYMQDREDNPRIKSNCGKNILYPYLRKLSDIQRDSLRTEGPDEDMPIEYTVRLILQVYELSKRGPVRLGPFKRDLQSEHWHRVWQTIKWLTKSKATTDRGADRSRWEIAKARESVDAPELWWMNDDIPDEVINPNLQDEEPNDGVVFPPAKFQIYWKNWSQYQHMAECPAAVQDLPDPRAFPTPQGFRDQLRGIYRMPELGINISLVQAEVTPAIPFSVGPPTQTLSIKDSWKQIVGHCTNEQPSAIKWFLITRTAAENEPIFEEEIPHRLQSLVGRKENGDLFAIKNANIADETGEETMQADDEDDVDQDDDDLVQDIHSAEQNGSTEYPRPDVTLGDFDPTDSAMVRPLQKELITGLWNDYDIIDVSTRTPGHRDIAMISEIVQQEVALTGESLTPEEITNFRTFQQSKINTGTIGLDYTDACESLGVQRNTNVMNGIKIPLKPHQITGLAWMLRQECGTVRTPSAMANEERLRLEDTVGRIPPTNGGILGDDPGLGKTLLCIALLTYHALNHRQGEPHKPSLILCPPSVLMNWKEELEKFSSVLRVLVYWGSDNGSTLDKIRISDHDIADWPEKLDGVNKKYRFLFDQNNVRAGKTVILSTLPTWAARTYTPSRDKVDENGDVTRVPESSRFTGVFGHVIVDEGHLAKTATPRINRSIRSLEATYRWLVTATPFFNRKEDILGLLGILWREEWLDEFTDEDRERIQKGVANPYRALNTLDPSDLRRRVALSPTAAARMLREAVTLEGELDLVTLRRTLPLITGQILLRRTYGTQIPDRHGDMPLEVGSSIPPYTITTVELQMSSVERHEHNTWFRVLAAEFERKRKAFQDQNGEQGNNTDNFRFPWNIWRRMTILASSVLLERLAHVLPPGGTLLKAIEGWRVEGLDYRFLTDQTLMDGEARPRTKGEEIRHLTYGSPKIRYLIGVIIQRVVITKKRKLLVFFENVLTQEWVAKVLEAMYFKVDVMFSSLSMTAKGEMASRFREPGSEVQILLCTYRVGGVGQNLHTDCSHVVLFEAGTSTSVEIQAYGRLRREGQGQPQVIWRLFQMDSINGYQEFKQLEKMRGEIAGWTNNGMEDVLRDLLAAEEQGEDSYYDLRHLSTLERAIDLYHAKLMGQRQTRGQFSDFWGPIKVQDKAAKDILAAKQLRNGPVV